MKMIKTHSCPFIFSSLQHNAWNKGGIKYCGMNEVSFHSEVWGHTHVFSTLGWFFTIQLYVLPSTEIGDLIFSQSAILEPRLCFRLLCCMLSCVSPLGAPPFVFYLLPMWHVGILVPQPGMKPAPLALELQSLNHWTSRVVPKHPQF